MVVSSNDPKSWIIPNGVDRETAFKIETKVEAFWNKTDDGRKVYVKGKTLTWIVDSDRFSLCDLHGDLLQEFGWGKCQATKIWILEKNEGRKVCLVSESQIPEMFKMYEKERVIVLHVVVCDSNDRSNYFGTDVAYLRTPAQPKSGVEIWSQSQVDNSHEHGYVDLNDDEDFGVDVQFQPEPNLSNNVHEESIVDGAIKHEPIMTYDLENPKIEVGIAFADVSAFRKALRHFAIKHEFEVATIKTDKQRFIGKCKNPSCPWRIRASISKKKKACVVKKLPYEHTCPSTTMVDGKMASKSWIADRVTDWLRKNPSEGPKAVKNKLEDEYHVKITYNKAWAGRQSAFDQIHGAWEESFQSMYNFKCELEKICPESIVEIESERIDSKVRFRRAFVALKPCIDGFLHGCRPYLGVDSTVLTGKYRGQLASTCGIDGKNCLYPVAYGVFDLETTDN